MLDSQPRLFSIVCCLLAASASGCGAAAYGDYKDALTAANTTGTDTDGGTVGSSDSVTLTTVTSNTDGGQSGSSTGTTADTDATDGTTTEGIRDGPEVVDVSLWPAVITANGPLTVEVDASLSQGVRLLLESGATVELSETEPGHFVGEIPVLTGSDNGQHSVAVVAWSDEDESNEVDAVYFVDLPDPGAELLWEASDNPFIGKGWVVAMGSLPTGDIIELITRDGEDGRRCSLRRRSPQGDWNPNSIVELLSGEECEGIDLAIGEDGTIHTLVSQKIGLNTWRWSLSKTSTFGGEATEVGAGSIDEEATALALRRNTGAVAVCGATPSGFGDLDAFVRVYEPGEWEKIATFDAPVDGKKHQAAERPRDCVYVDDDRLVLVGDAFGKHDNGEEPVFRRFFLPVDLNADEDPSFTIGPKGFASQSFATAVDTDGLGLVYATGYACDDPCEGKIEGRLWVYDVEGAEKSEHTLGFFSYPELAPHALAWSPAEYLVIANGGFQGEDASFVVRAFAADNFVEPLWTFARKDLFVLHIPMVAFVGRYAQLHFGGLGANVYPGVLFLGS